MGRGGGGKGEQELYPYLLRRKLRCGKALSEKSQRLVQNHASTKSQKQESHSSFKSRDYVPHCTRPPALYEHACLYRATEIDPLVLHTARSLQCHI